MDVWDVVLFSLGRNALEEQSKDIARNASIHADTEARLQDRIKVLEKEQDEIHLICFTLLRTLVLQDIITEADFGQLASEIREEAHDRAQRSVNLPPVKQPTHIDFSNAKQKPNSLYQWSIDTVGQFSFQS